MFHRRRALVLVLFRVSCIAFSATWFVPDEVFQSGEVAYHMVYKRGHLTWEWNPDWALRSTVHPLLYAAPFWALRQLQLDFGWVVRLVPHLVQAVLFAFADSCYINWVNQICLHQNASKIALALYFSNWFILYCCTRTLSNTLECCLSIIALNWYQSKTSQSEHHYAHLSRSRFYVLCVSLASILRPTSILLWAPLALAHLWDFVVNKGGFNVGKTREYIFRLLIPYGFTPLILTTVADSIYYGRPTLCLWNFLHFNVFRGGNAHFGSHPWHWYFTQGLPPLLTFGCIPLATLVTFRRAQLPRSTYYVFPFFFGYVLATVLYIVGHTLITHKEHRFLLPVLPIILASIALELNSHWSPRLKNYTLFAMIASNFLMALYFGMVHQRGPNAANAQILNLLEQRKPADGKFKILQLMPCFSLPQFVGLHPHSSQIEIRMLDCTESMFRAMNQNPSNSKASEHFEDESDKFHADPLGWLNANWYVGKMYDSDLVVAYADVYAEVDLFLFQKGFNKHSRIFHTFYASSSRQSSHIVIALRDG